MNQAGALNECRGVAGGTPGEWTWTLTSQVHLAPFVFGDAWSTVKTSSPEAGLPHGSGNRVSFLDGGLKTRTLQRKAWHFCKAFRLEG